MKRLAFLLAATIPFASSAAHADEDGQLWIAPILQTPIVGKLRSYLELQARWKDEGKELDRLIVRPAINYGLGSGFTAWVGYGYMPFTRPNDDKLYPEHRPWQQLMHAGGDPALGQVTNRLRFEERFIDRVDDPAFRLRYMIRLVLRPKSWSGFGFALWDEIFVNLNSPTGGPRAGFDQNRFAVALQYAVSKKLIFEPTYMALTQWRFERTTLIGHTGLLFVWITL
jgi:hypothetical protein